jgi:hypothetical protein
MGAWWRNVLVGTDTGGLKSLGRQLLVLVGDEVNASGEVIDGSLLATEVEDADLGIGDTTVEARLGVRLKGKVSQYVELSCVPDYCPFHDRKRISSST